MRNFCLTRVEPVCCDPCGLQQTAGAQRARESAAVTLSCAALLQSASGANTNSTHSFLNPFALTAPLLSHPPAALGDMSWRTVGSVGLGVSYCLFRAGAGW